MPGTLLLLLSGLAAGQSIPDGRPAVPSAGLATEGGPGTLWVNPAHLAYDPDARWGVFLGAPSTGAPFGFAATAGVGGLGLGVHHQPAAGGTSEWTLDYATSLKLPERIALGLNMRWHLVADSRNYVAYDAGLAWRPLPWLGFSAVAWDIGAPDPRGLVAARSGVGLALRPFGGSALIGLDYLHRFDPDDPRGTFRATTRLRATEGLYLRGGVDSDGTLGAGFEVFFDGAGGGLSVTGSDPSGADAFGVAWLGSGEPAEGVLRGGRRVPVLDLEEVPPYQPQGGLLTAAPPSWLETLQALRRAEEDPSTRGLVVVLGQSAMSWARYEEVRGRIEAMEAKGKPVVAYLTGSPSNGSFYAASAASRVVMHPAATLDLVGLSAEMTYLKGALDIVGVEPQFVRRSDFKTAMEQYTRAEPSDPQLEQTDALLDDLFGSLVDGVAAGRAMRVDEVRQAIDGGPYGAEEALALGLVDQLAYPDDVESILETTVGGRVKTRRLHDMPTAHSAWVAPAQVAVVYVEGAIVSGESSAGGLLSSRTAGSRTVVRGLEQAAADPSVRAVVLRVDSPGGSAFASDEIWRAVEELQERGKPVVVSMGGVAASGGYYVAAGADAIWAEPTTITGSIGVFSGKFAMTGLFDRVGVTTTTISRGRNADLYGSHGWDPVQRARMEELVDGTYLQFKDRVAEGRGLSPEEVEEVARGRVWSGRRAAEVGLVDGLGGLDEAIADARRRAGIAESRELALVTLPSGSGTPEVLAPGLTVLARPVVRALGVGSRERVLDDLPTPLLADAFAPFVVWALHGDGAVWMMSPWALETETR